MPRVSHGLAVRARVVPRNEPPFDRLYDPVVDDLLRDGPLSRSRFATRWSDTEALKRLVEAKRRPLPRALSESLLDEHRRLGATAASMAALDRVVRGEAVCTVAGQQPGPLGGPLYSLHKTAAAVGMAAIVTRRTGVPCVPLFWVHGEDSDFPEIRGATLADAGLQLHDLQLPAEAHRDGGLVGSVPASYVRALHDEAVARWEGLPAAADAAALLARAGATATDLGDVFAAMMLALFGDQGLVVVDPRRPAFRDAARPILERYLAASDALGQAARRAGDEVERALGRRPLADSALESFVFAIDDDVRRKCGVEEAQRRAAAGGVLSPSVALRPAVQDGVFPTVAMACGPAEIAYLAQLREVFEGVGVRAACPVPRFSATWLPPAATELLDASGAAPWELITAADAVLKSLAERDIPAEVRTELEDARRSAGTSMDRFAQASRRVDASLPQMVESARGKIDYQFARLMEGVSGKMRHRLEREHPQWARVRYHLLPGDRLQERRLASMSPVASRGVGVGAELAEASAVHAERVAAGVHEHWVLEL